MIKTGAPIALDEKGNIITWDYFETDAKWYLPKSEDKVQYFDRNSPGINIKDWRVITAGTMS